MAALTIDVPGPGVHRLRGGYIAKRGQYEGHCRCGSRWAVAALEQDRLAGEFAVHVSLIGDRSPGRTHACAAPIGQCGCAYDAWLARQTET